MPLGDPTPQELELNLQVAQLLQANAGIAEVVHTAGIGGRAPESVIVLAGTAALRDERTRVSLYSTNDLQKGPATTIHMVPARSGFWGRRAAAMQAVAVVATDTGVFDTDVRWEQMRWQPPELGFLSLLLARTKWDETTTMHQADSIRPKPDRHY